MVLQFEDTFMFSSLKHSLHELKLNQMQLDFGNFKVSSDLSDNLT